MLFVDDITLVDESLVEVNNKHEKWMAVLEGKELKINRSKTEYIKYGFGVRE